jgi:tRNA nucleotidyltransferase (CCA-adding enzyme)
MSVHLDPPPAVRWIARTLEEAGFEAWAVGGAVRDALLGVPSGDWDLTTRARPSDVRRIFRRTVPIGVEHGTVGVLARDRVMYEVTTFRRDVRTDGRHAVVSFADRLEDDLGRRDFTINAIAWHPLREDLRDPYGGADDLERRVLRTVGAPEGRFREDYLRILRALRFAGRYRLEIDADTWAAARALVEHTRGLSAERIRDELLKVLDQDPGPGRALELYAASGVLATLYPELERLRGRTTDAGLDAWAASVATAAELPPRRPYLRLAALLREVPPAEAAALLTRLRLSNARVDGTLHLAAAPPIPPPGASDADVRRWLSRVGPERLAALGRLDLARARAVVAEDPREDRRAAVAAAWRRARHVRAARPPLAVGDLELDGRGLMALGLKPGPHFGVLLEGLLDWVLEDPERNRKELLVERVLASLDAADTAGGTGEEAGRG